MRRGLKDARCAPGLTESASAIPDVVIDVAAIRSEEEGNTVKEGSQAIFTWGRGPAATQREKDGTTCSHSAQKKARRIQL